MRPSETKIEILFEDSDLLIVNKPSGLPCHATVDKNRVHLMAMLRNVKPEPILLHRLDVDTSGLLILTKNSAANLKMQEHLKHHRIEKHYLCISENLNLTKSLHKELEKVRTEILKSISSVKYQNYLSPKKIGKRELMTPVKSGGSTAISLIQKLRSGDNWLSFKIQIITGRKHQIRSHMKSLSWPILGDTLYNENSKIKFPRLGLHSWKIKFPHPTSEHIIELEAPLPTEFLNYF